VLGPGGIAVVAMRGATNISRFLDLLGPAGIGVRIGGRCDAGQEDYFRNALERAGFGLSMSRADREALGFCVCTAGRAITRAFSSALLTSPGFPGHLTSCSPRPDPHACWPDFAACRI
jgi:hypothetical protein